MQKSANNLYNVLVYFANFFVQYKYIMTMAPGTRQRWRQRQYAYRNRAMTPPGRAQNTRSIVTLHQTEKEQGMKRGHVTGTKRERQGASNWYKAIEAETLKRIEAEWQAKQQASK
jgi:hypothetical protein